MSRRCEAVLFDMGYTLLAPHPSFEELVSGKVAEFGIDLSPQQVRAVEAGAWLETNEAFGDPRYTLSHDHSYEFWCRFYEIMLERAGVPSVSEEVCPALYGVFSAHDSYAFYDDVFPVLEELRGRGLRLGVISNWEAWLHDLLGARGVQGEFECIIVSGAVGLEKPDPEIFHLAFRELSVAPERCVYVGDSLKYDVMPSLEVGAVPVLIDRRGKHEGHDLPCRRITSLRELLTMDELVARSVC